MIATYIPIPFFPWSCNITNRKPQTCLLKTHLSVMDFCFVHGEAFYKHDPFRWLVKLLYNQLTQQHFLSLFPLIAPQTRYIANKGKAIPPQFNKLHNSTISHPTTSTREVFLFSYNLLIISIVSPCTKELFSCPLFFYFFPLCSPPCMYKDLLNYLHMHTLC